MANILRTTLRSSTLELCNNLKSRAINTRATLCSPFSEVVKTVVLSDKKTLTISTGKYAKMANGAAVVQAGDTSVMVTAVSKESASTEGDFMPLNVEFRMKSAAAGRIPTNYLRRELGLSEREILTARLIDRSIRPLFPKNYFSEVQVLSNMLSVDGVNDPEVISINAASTALALSNIPWNGPIAAVRLGMIGDSIIINPTRQELKDSSMNLVLTGEKSSKIVMLEGSFNNSNINDIMRAFRLGVTEVKKIITAIESLAKEAGKVKLKVGQELVDQELLDYLHLNYSLELKEILTNFTFNKQTRDDAVSALREDIVQRIKDEGTKSLDSNIKLTFNVFLKDVFRNLMFDTDKRCDGRGMDDIRPIACDVNLYEPLHGSSLFQRGQTQVLCTVALDSPESAVKTDSYTILTGGLKDKSFFLNYEFPGYAVNEITQRRGINRREIGHGALAEKGLRPVVPPDFPFCIRLTSEVLESNGSSSMASVCGGSLALLDAGVPISSIAGGVAMGLITRCDSYGEIVDYKILTDIMGMEDYFGDMDFKIAGTSNGVTALQADFKIPGVPLEILHKALSKGHAANKLIIKILKKAKSTPSLKEGNMPILETFEVPIHKRKNLLGPAWVNIKKLFLQTGVQITHVEDSKFSVFAPNDAAMQEAYDAVKKLMETSPEPEFEFGAIYDVKVLELKESGVSVSLHPQLHPVFINNTHLDVRRTSHPSALGLSVGDKISVKYFGRDPASGQIRLSSRALQELRGGVIDHENIEPKPTIINREKVTSLNEVANGK